MSKYVFVIQLSFGICIWPPPYQIHLNHSEEFVIFENFGGNDEDDIYSDEDEMIKESDIKKFDLSKDSDKYFRIHKYAMAMGMKQAKNDTPKQSQGLVRRIKWRETNFDKEDDEPYIAGFFDNNNSNVLRENSNVFYLNEMAKMTVDVDVAKRSNAIMRRKSDKEPDYDYSAFKKEYDAEVRKLKAATETLQFVDVKEEESVKDSVEKMIDFKKPKNCTAEEAKGIGLGAVQCFVSDLRNGDPKNSRNLWYKISRLAIIWLAVYLLIVIPCWCQKGWCCCCFRCRFCRPLKRIDEAKKFIADNPPGTYRTPEGKIFKYKPTHYEMYAQKKLEQALMKL